MSYSEYLEIGTSNEFTESMLSNNVFYMELNSGTVICHTCIMVVATLDDEGLVTFSNGSAQLNTSMVDKLFISREDSMTLLCLPPSRTTTTETAYFAEDVPDNIQGQLEPGQLQNSSG